jgi:hypothetical protein
MAFGDASESSSQLAMFGSWRAEPADAPKRRVIKIVRPRRVSLPVIQSVRDDGPSPTDRSGIACPLSAWEVQADLSRPATLEECTRAVFEDTSPCPHISCRYHLWNEPVTIGEDGTPSIPARMRQFERMVEAVPPERWGETCSLRVARRVEVVETETDKFAAHSKDGEPICATPPRYDEETGRWVDREPKLRFPTVLNEARVGRLMGLSREAVRKAKITALQACKANAALRQEAEDRHLGGVMAAIFSDEDAGEDPDIGTESDDVGA